MSNHFYKYLAEKVETYFRTSVLHPGDKYHVQFERREHVEQLVLELYHLPTAIPFVMPTESNGYYTFCLRLQNVKLIIASTSADTTPDFLTNLRNRVGVESDDLFRDAAILLVHDSNLDSLVNGMTSFSKEGMPFYLKSVERDLRELMQSTQMSKTEKTVIDFLMDVKKEETYQEQHSLFDYEDVLKVLNRGQIVEQDFIDFGLFYDSQLTILDLPPKKVKERLKENYDLFQKVETIHKFGEVESGLERHFDDAGVRMLSKSEDWKTKDFKQVHESNQNKLKDKGIEYLGVTKKRDGAVFWDREDGQTKAKQRVRHILIFNPEARENLTLEFSFNDSMSAKYISPLKNTKSTVEASGKRLVLNLRHEAGKTNFLKFTYKTETSGKFEFRVASAECNEQWLSPFQTSYKVQVSAATSDSHLLIQSDATEWKLNESGLDLVEKELTGLPGLDRFEVQETQSLMIRKQLVGQQEDDLLRFHVCLPHTEIPLAVELQDERPVQITGFAVWKLKRQNEAHFTLRVENDSFKIIQGTRENFAQGEFRKSLERERKLLELGTLAFREQFGQLEGVALDVPTEIMAAYENLLTYFKVYRTLPSLAFLNDEYRALARDYVGTYYRLLEQLQHGDSLNQQMRNLVWIGTVECVTGDKEWLFTPLHPLNVAYQLHLHEQIGQTELSDELLKTMRTTNLLPYILYRDGKVYKPIEQWDAPEWTIYVDHELPRYEGNRNYVNKLIHEKIEEFTAHFAYLFSLDRRSPLRINVINMGDGREILQGIMEYYKRQISKKKVAKTDLLPLELNLYSESGVVNVFEQLSMFQDVNQLCAYLELKLDVDGYRPEEFLNLFREKVRFYSKDVRDEKYDYCHIAFYQMSQIEQMASSLMTEMPTGLSLGGLISGVPSVFVNDNYKTGFGTKYFPESDSQLIRLVPKLNAFMRVALGPDSYFEGTSLVTAISAEHKNSLDRIYESSHWVTFVDPRVDLSFFKNDNTQKELLVIHYSDQYTSSSSYDAITVTRRSSQYQKMIYEFLKSQGIEVQEADLPHIINFFNAMNGNWLLRLLAHHNHFKEEKMSILSAVKLSLAYLHRPDIVWTPISMEEILRVSGGVGLKRTDGLFSTENLGKSGSFSDDLLMIGVEEHEGGLKVRFFPIEVKIGNNGSDVRKKAIDQVTRTLELLQEFLGEPESVHAKLYRNFFMQLTIVSAEKMKLYDIWPEQHWDRVIGEYRQRLLNDDYEIVFESDTELGTGAAIFFSRAVIFEEVEKTENITLVHFPERSGYHFLLRNIEELRGHVSGAHPIEIPILTEAEAVVSDVVEEPMVQQDIEEPFDHGQEENLQQVEGERHGESFENVVAPQEDEEAQEIQAVVEQQVTQMKKEAAITESGPKKPLSVLFGHDARTKQEVRWFPTMTDRVMHTNTGIIGTMGTGKTQFTKSLVTQLYQNSGDNVNRTKIGLLIFDYKGDYIKPEFVQATGAKVYDLYRLKYNPLALYVTENSRNLLPMHTGNTLTDTITKAFGLGQVQSFTLRDLIKEAYEQQGIQMNNRESWKSPAPTMRDVYKLYLGKQVGKIDSLHAALKDLHDFEIFEPDATQTVPLFEMIDGITVINLSGYNESIQNLVVAITLDVFYSQMQITGHSTIEGNLREITRMILVDEADNFLSKDFGAIKKIMKEGREFGVGTILSTQFLTHFSTSEIEYSNYILTWIVHNVAEMSNRDIRMLFNTQSKQEEENMMNKIKTLEKHYSIVKGIGNQAIWMRDKAFWELVNK